MARNLEGILKKKRNKRNMNVYAVINKCVAGWCGLWLASPLAAQSVRMAGSWGLEDVVALANAQCAFYSGVIRDLTEADLSYEK